MLKIAKLFQSLIFIILTINFTNQTLSNGVIPEDYFVPLNSREISSFELNKNKNEVYYYFQNDYEDSDIILNFKIAKGFTTYFYIYDSYESIQKNDQGDYINYIKEFLMTENDIVLKSSDLKIKKSKYYFIIKNLINSNYKDYISIFNEQDIISLVNEKYILIEKFYSKNKYKFSFSHTKNEIVTLELNINNKQFSQYISIYNGNDLIYRGEKNRGEIKLNEEKENEGTYSLEIESQEEPYIDIKSSIMLHKDEKYVKELKYNAPLPLSYIENKVFNFYVDLDDYDYNDENIVTFKFGNQIFDRKLLSHCYAKVMNFEANEDTKFLANMPANEDENEASFSRLSGNTNIYQLYFKNTKQKENNKKTFLLIHLSIKLEEHDTDEFINPDNFTIYLSNRPEKLKLSDYKNKNIILNRNIKLNNYVPEVYKIEFPKIDENSNKLSYIFYCSENIAVFYNNSMLKDNHLYEKTKMIHALSYNVEGYDYTNTLYIKIYGFTNKEVNLRIESIEGTIYYVNNDYRHIKSFTDKLTDCSKPFYYIGNYGLMVTKGYFYQETLYGKINTYYKGKINPEDESILINEDEKYLVKNNFLSLDTSIDIVELKCEFPGFYQFHLIDDVDERDINLYSKIYNFLPAQKNFTIWPVLSPLQEDINFEISTPTGKEIQISDGEKIVKIDSNNKYYHMKYKNYTDIPASFTVLSNEDTIISITLTNKDPFVIVDSDSAHVDYDSQIIVKLRQDTKYESVNIIVTRIYHGYSYSVFKGNVEYASKLIESEFDYINIDMKHKINVTISNPYLRGENSNIKKNDENNVYYLMFSIDDPEMIQKDVILTYNEIKEYEKIDIDNFKTIINQNEKYSLPLFSEEIKDINIVYQSCDNSLKDINIYNYNDKLQTIFNDKKESFYRHDLIKNYYSLNLQISLSFKENEKKTDPLLNGAVIGITDQKITDDDLNKYINLKLNVSQNEDKIEWEILDNINQYDVFVINENNSYASNLKNPCLLDSIKNNLINKYNNNGNDSYIKHYSSDTNYIKLEEKGKYYVVISASIKGKVPLIYIYDKVIYDSSLIPPEPEPEPEPDPEPKPDPEPADEGGNGNTIFLAVGIPLVVIVVLVLLIVLVKCRKNSEIDINHQQISLIRNTQNEED